MCCKGHRGILHNWLLLISSDGCSDGGSKGQIRNLRLGRRLFAITSSKRDCFKRTLLAETRHRVVSQSKSNQSLKLQSAVALLDCAREIFGGRRAAEVYFCWIFNRSYHVLLQIYPSILCSLDYLHLSSLMANHNNKILHGERWYTLLRGDSYTSRGTCTPAV